MGFLRHKPKRMYNKKTEGFDSFGHSHRIRIFLNGCSPAEPFSAYSDAQIYEFLK
jgi:hypothetical protein